MKVSSRTKKIKIYGFILFVVITTTLLWYLGNKPDFSNLNKSSILTYAGQLTALVGIIFMSVNYILAARYKFIENSYAGLDKIYRLHMFFGIGSYTLILLHPIFLAARFLDEGTRFASFFIPYLDNSFAKNLGIAAFWIFTLLIFSAGLRKLPYHIWKLTHSFLGIPILLGGFHAILAESTTKNFEPMTVWIGFWVLWGFAAYIYKVFLYDYLGPVYKYVITEITQTSELFEVYMKPVRKKLNFLPGQFAFIKFKNSGIFPESHPYTMSSTPNEDRLEFSIKKLGDWSNSLGLLKVGDSVKVSGPHGHFCRPHLRNCSKQVWIGGGIGITPFLSMGRAEAINPSCDKIFLIYSDDNKEQAIFQETVETFSHFAKNLTVINHLTLEQGYLNADEIEKWVGGLEDTIFLLCGPSAMTNALKAQFIAKGVKDTDIIFEYFNFK